MIFVNKFITSLILEVEQFQRQFWKSRWPCFTRHFRQSHTVIEVKSVTFLIFELEKFQRWFWKSHFKYSRSDQVSLKWSFTHKQHAWEPPLNHSWKFDLWPLQTGILKINAGFAEKSRKKWKKSLGRRQNRVLVILVWGFWAVSPIFRPNFGKLI